MLSRFAFLRHGVLAAALGILVPGAASAHAMLHSSDPADGATLNASPRTLNLAFTEDCRVTALRLLDEGGREHQVRREGGRAGEPLDLGLDLRLARWLTFHKRSLLRASWHCDKKDYRNSAFKPLIRFQVWANRTGF